MESENEVNSVNEYILNGIHAVNGWCNPKIWQLIWPLYQEIGRGAVGEIGVYEGKFLLGLIKTFDARNECSHAAIDIFDQQELNVDRSGSGRGRREIFLTNLDDNGIRRSVVDVYEMDSLDIRVGDNGWLTDERGRFKFFSVDGGMR